MHIFSRRTIEIAEIICRQFIHVGVGIPEQFTQQIKDHFCSGPVSFVVSGFGAVEAFTFEVGYCQHHRAAIDDEFGLIAGDAQRAVVLQIFLNNLHHRHRKFRRTAKFEIVVNRNFIAEF